MSFDALPTNVMTPDYNCPSCSGKLRYTDDTFREAVSIINPHLKVLSEHHGQLSPITVKCSKCKRTSEYHAVSLTSKIIPGCKHCATGKGYSRVALNWLDTLRKENNIQIQDATTTEFYIRDLGIHVDGYCEATKTIYEFLGDCWHGNLGVYTKKSKPNPYTDLTAKQLMKQDVRRFRNLTSLGYKVYYVYESDYHAGCAPIRYQHEKALKFYCETGPNGKFGTNQQGTTNANSSGG